MKVKDIMAVGALTVPRDATVEAAARLMRDQSVGMLLVGDEGQLDGVVTDRDLLVRCVAVGDSPLEAKVAEYMSSDVTTCRPEDDPFEAASIMRVLRLHRLPVTERGKTVGVISLTDIAQAMDEPLHNLLIGSGVVRRAAMATFVGIVSHYYNYIGVAAFNLQAPLHKNDVIHIVGRTTDLKQPVISMQIDHKPVDVAYPGDDIAVKVNERVRTGDSVYMETTG